MRRETKAIQSKSRHEVLRETQRVELEPYVSMLSICEREESRQILIRRIVVSSAQQANVMLGKGNRNMVLPKPFQDGLIQFSLG